MGLKRYINSLGKIKTSMNEISPICKYCQSKHVIRYGMYKKTQYYFCRNCGHKFASTNTIAKMKYPISRIAQVLHMYYEGASLSVIRRHFIQEYNEHISPETAWNWINRFSKLVARQSVNYKVKVSDAWVAYENIQTIGGKAVTFWDILDTKTLFLNASYLTCHPTIKDAVKLMKQAYNRTGKIPKVIYADKLGIYLESIVLSFGNKKSEQVRPLKIENKPALTRPLHWTIESRTNVMRGLHTEESARLLMEGWLIHYNYFTPRVSLKGSTPAVMAHAEFPFNNWKDACEQFVSSLPKSVKR